MRLESLFRPGVYSVPPDVTLAEAAIEMRRDDIGSLAVLDDGRLVGIVTERDLVRRGRQRAGSRSACVISLSWWTATSWG